MLQCMIIILVNFLKCISASSSGTMWRTSLFECLILTNPREPRTTMQSCSSLICSVSLLLFLESTPLGWANAYLRVTIICRYIFLWFWVKTQFASTKFWNLYAKMVQGWRSILHIANVRDTKFCVFGPIHNPQKLVTMCTFYTGLWIIFDDFGVLLEHIISQILGPALYVWWVRVDIDLMAVEYVSCLQIGIQTRTVADLTAVANLVRSNNVPLLFVALLLLQFLSMVVDRSV